MRYVIQKLGRDFKSIVITFHSDQTISLRIINEKQGSTSGEIHSKGFIYSFQNYLVLFIKSFFIQMIKKLTAFFQFMLSSNNKSQLCCSGKNYIILKKIKSVI